jgi:putative ABC transport system permease protein
MWTFIRLATRNVNRNRSRTALTLAAIGFGVLMTVFLQGFSQGFTDMITDDSIKAKVGALQIHRAGFFEVKDSSPLDFGMEEGGELERKIRSVKGVSDVTGRLTFQSIVNGPAASSMLMTTGVDPAHEYNVLPYSLTDIAGKPISSEAKTGAVIGLEIADSLGLVTHSQQDVNGKVVDVPSVKAGSSAIISAARKSGQQNALDVDVVGLINSGNAFESKRLGFVPLRFAQDLLDMNGQVNEYLISVANREEIPRVKQDILTALGPGYEAQDWKDVRPNVADVISVQRIILTSICFVFLIIAVIGVVNTMLMSVMERTREIGTMMAVGVTRAQVTLLFLLEGIVLALIGGAAGAIGGTLLVKGICAVGGLPITVPGSTALRHILPPAPPFILAIAVAAALLGTLGASVYPAWRASRLRPVEALAAV